MILTDSFPENSPKCSQVFCIIQLFKTHSRHTILVLKKGFSPRLKYEWTYDWVLCCQKSLLFLFICGWVFNKFGKMQCERKIQKQTNKFREAIARKQRFGHNYIQILQDYIYCPRHEVTMGFSTVCTERVIQFSRPDGKSYWTLRRRDWKISR